MVPMAGRNDIEQSWDPILRHFRWGYCIDWNITNDQIDKAHIGSLFSNDLYLESRNMKGDVTTTMVVI